MSRAAEDWIHNSYMSGTQVVACARGFRMPHFHIGHLPADTEGDGGRTDVGRELCAWLNGGAEPWWLDLTKRLDGKTLVTPHGCEISAIGPMVDRAEAPSWGDWHEDDSEEAKFHRIRMLNALMRRERVRLAPEPKEGGASCHS